MLPDIFSRIRNRGGISSQAISTYKPKSMYLKRYTV